MNTKIGETAGRVWRALGEKEAIAVSRFPQILKEKGEIAYQALGWLPREDKIDFYKKEWEEIKARSVDAMKSLEMMALTRRVEAVFIEADFSPTSVSVSVLEPGKIQLTGTVSEQSKKIRAGRS